MKKHLLFPILILVIVTVGLVMFLLSDKASYEWEPLTDTEYGEHLLDTPIQQIRLRKTVTSPEWAVFEDADLIAVWTEYLQNAEVQREKRSKSADNTNTNGGGMAVIDITTGTGNFSLLLSDTSESCRIEFDDILYTISSSTPCPFNYTYNEAVERHGITTPW